MCGGRRSFGATTPKFTACNTMQLHRQAGVAHRAAHQADGPRTQLFSRLEGSIRVAAAGTAPVSMTLAATRCTPALLRRPCSIVAQAHGTPPREYTLSEAPKKRLAFFVSGGGSNFKAIHAAMLDGRIGAEAAVVVSDVPSCGGVQYAQSHGISTLTYPIPKSGAFPGLNAEQLVNALKEEQKVDYVILAGYLKLIPINLVLAYPNAMLNIHPGLLPSFGGKGMYGERVHKAVIASGVRFSGPTVHFVNEEFDTGPILAQRVVPVFPTDTPKTLAGRVLKEEHQVYPEAVSALVDGRITWREDGIPIMWSAH